MSGSAPHYTQDEFHTELYPAPTGKADAYADIRARKPVGVQEL